MPEIPTYLPQDLANQPEQSLLVRQTTQEQDWLRRAGDGDETAFNLIYQRYATLTFNYLLRLLHESEVAEDLLQEVFLAVWKGAHKFQGKSQVKTWIFRIAHHQAVSWLRRGRKTESLDEQHELTTADNVELSVQQILEAERVQAALEKLSTNHRAVVELAFAHNMNYQEISVVLDCPVGTVKSRMSYALKYLAGFLDQTPANPADPSGQFEPNPR